MFEKYFHGDTFRYIANKSTHKAINMISFDPDSSVRIQVHIVIQLALN